MYVGHSGLACFDNSYTHTLILRSHHSSYNVCRALGREDPGLRAAAASALNGLCVRLGTRLPGLLLHSGEPALCGFVEH